MKDVAQLDVRMDNLRVGGLASDARGEIFFEYDPSWVAGGYALSPMNHFRLRQRAFKSSNKIFDGLHGVFNDALPDGWGLRLMHRALKARAGWNPHEITPLDRLAYIGDRAMGALEFYPAIENDATDREPSLGELAEAALLVEEGKAGEILRALFVQGGSPGGARPKVTVALQRDSDHCLCGFGTIPDDYDHWLVKFRSKEGDPECIGRVEKAYAQMAVDAGVIMPETRLVSAVVRGKPQDFFAVQRFDRNGNQKRHVLSLGAMLEANYRLPCLDYDGLFKAVLLATKDVREVVKAFRVMVFNVLGHNKDDHLKNFSFIHQESQWRLSPAYDLTFSAGMNNHHMTSVSGKGNPSMQDIRALAQKHEIADWKTIVNEVRETVCAWSSYAKAWNVDAEVARAYADAMLALPCALSKERL